VVQEETMFQKSKAFLFISFALCLLLICLAGCLESIPIPEETAHLIAEGETLVQISTIDAILNGLYDGVMDYGSLKKYGDFGIGTFAGLDGEMVAVDGRYYQIKADGVAYPVEDAIETPFASVTFFNTDDEQQLPEVMNFTQLQAFLDEKLPTENIFYAIKIVGTFTYMKTRSVPGQEKPYPPLVEVTANQPVFEFENVEGTIVGFRSPPYVAGVNVPGYHLHFLTKVADAGGHILDFTIQQAVAYIDYTSDFLMILPGEESDFYRLDLSQDKQEELEKAEK
jgi:acetolactate decarboxylase